MDDARTTKGREKRKLGYKFIGGACLVGVGSDVARAANLFRRGKGAPRVLENARRRSCRAAIKSFHYLNWVLLVGTCNQFFFPRLELRLCASYPLVTPSRSLAEMNVPCRSEKESQRVARGAAALSILPLINDSSCKRSSLSLRTIFRTIFVGSSR